MTLYSDYNDHYYGYDEEDYDFYDKDFETSLEDDYDDEDDYPHNDY